MSNLIIENLCDVKYPYRTTPVYIQDEEYTIETDVPYSISLKETPSPDYPVTIIGYNESDCAPFTETDFYVDYTKSLIYFYSTEAGNEVLVTYYKTGSPIIAGDVNRFSLFLDNLYDVLFSFVVEALSGCRVRLYGGSFVDSVSGDTTNMLKELFMDFGINGNFQLSAMTEGYFKRILIGVNTSTLQVTVIEGEEVPKYEAALLPSYTTLFKPLAIVTVAESNGSIADITQADIETLHGCFCR